jgi:hypothetical protein
MLYLIAKSQVKHLYPPKSVMKVGYIFRVSNVLGDRRGTYPLSTGNFHLLIWLYIVLKATFILLFTSYFASIITYFPF